MMSVCSAALVTLICLVKS